MRFHNITATKSTTRDDFENKSSQIIQEKKIKSNLHKIIINYAKAYF
jgi:hypothetical protein